MGEHKVGEEKDVLSVINVTRLICSLTIPCPPFNPKYTVGPSRCVGDQENECVRCVYMSLCVCGMYMRGGKLESEQKWRGFSLYGCAGCVSIKDVHKGI